MNTELRPGAMVIQGDCPCVKKVRIGPFLGIMIGNMRLNASRSQETPLVECTSY